MGVSSRVAIVTGAGSGIGRGIANGLAKAGARVAIFDVDATTGAAAAAAINEMHGTGSASNYVLDLTDPAAVDEAVTEVVGSLGSLDILVNNAGVITGPTNVEDMPERDWDWVVGTNVKSQFLTSRAATPHMKGAGFGRIINIASRSWLGVAGRVHYSASKGAVISLTRSLAMELGEHGITANCVSPTLVVTPLFESTPKADQDEVMRRTRAQPIPRLGTVEDMAYAVLFFADENADFITGQHIYVGGGADLMTATP